MSINIKYDIDGKHYDENYDDMFLADSRVDWLEQVEKANNIELYSTFENCFYFSVNTEQFNEKLPF